MANIFVSYARKEIDLVRQIMLELHGFGINYWMDTRNLQGGDVWTEEITKAIFGCKKFLLFMSAASMASDNVRREVQLAYETGKPIIILRLEKVEIPKSLRIQLAGIQWIEYLAPDWESRLTIALTSRTKKIPVKPEPNTFQAKLKLLKPRERQKIAGVLSLMILLVVLLYIYMKPPPCVYQDVANSDPEAITWLIEQEAAAVVSKDMNLIKDIFTEDATIVDRAAYGGSPQTYFGPTNRYQDLFKDYDFSSATNTTIKATSPINGDTVIYISGSRGDYTGKQTEHYNHPLGSSRWTVKKIDGCWKITKFEFNVPN